ncbi:MAG TPA: hypothetical protein VIG88_02680 [Lysobacter sp.]
MAAIVLALVLVSPGAPGYVGAALAVASVAFIGGWDDHRPLPARRRLLVHLAAGVMLAGAMACGRGNVAVMAGTVAAVAVLVNVWNFMDGINGIAASQAGLVAAFAGLLLDGPASTVAFAIAVACAAFLPFNFPRARIFLGDVGSGALGVAVALLGSDAWRAGPATALAMLLPLSAFLVDAGLTLARRVLRGERWWEAHAQHLYQVLARRYGHTRVTLGYAAWTAACGAASLALPAGRPGFIIAVAAACYTAATALWLVGQRRFENGRDGRRTRKDR